MGLLGTPERTAGWTFSGGLLQVETEAAVNWVDGVASWLPSGLGTPDVVMWNSGLPWLLILGLQA